MKKIIFSLLIALGIILPALGQQKDYKQLYEGKIETYTRMSKMGWAMTGIGGGLAMTGTILLVALPDSYWYYDSYDSNYDDYDNSQDDMQAIGGFVSLAVGIGLIAGGITMGSIGSHKVKSYRSKLNNLSLGMICTPKKQGITLVYKF